MAVQQCTQIFKATTTPFFIRIPLLIGLFSYPFYSAVAGPADYVHTPRVEQGETEIGLKFGTFRRQQRNEEIEAAIGVGYGVTRWWSSEIYTVVEQAAGRSSGINAFEWENTFYFGSVDQHSTDVGFIFELERSQDRSEGYELVFGPLFQKSIGTAQFNLNLLFWKNYQSEEPMPLQLGYQFQSRWAISPQIGLGLQAFGEFGQWNQWADKDQQSHRLGPAFFGSIDLGGDRQLNYNAAVLMEASNAARGKILRAEIAYEF